MNEPSEVFTEPYDKIRKSYEKSRHYYEEDYKHRIYAYEEKKLPKM